MPFNFNYLNNILYAATHSGILRPSNVGIVIGTAGVPDIDAPDLASITLAPGLLAAPRVITGWLSPYRGPDRRWYQRTNQPHSFRPISAAEACVVTIIALVQLSSPLQLAHWVQLPVPVLLADEYAVLSVEYQIAGDPAGVMGWDALVTWR